MQREQQTPTRKETSIVRGTPGNLVLNRAGQGFRQAKRGASGCGINVWRTVSILLVGLLLITGCGSSGKHSAIKALQRMQASEFFEEPVQRALAEAIERGRLDRAREAIEGGADVNAVGREGMTPLFWALAKQKLDGFRFLLEQGANPNVVVDLPDSFSDREAGAMEMAAKLENPEYLRALLQHGGDPNTIVNEEWNIPLLYRAIMNRRPGNVVILLEFGADIDHQDQAGKTPLMQATSARMYEIALLLLKKGADPTIRNRWNNGPADIVRKFGDRGIDTRTNDLAAYQEFVAELRDRGLLD